MEEALFHVQCTTFPLHPSVLVLGEKQKNLLGRGGKPRGVLFTVSDNKTTVLGNTCQLMCFFSVMGSVRVSSPLCFALSGSSSAIHRLLTRVTS